MRWLIDIDDTLLELVDKWLEIYREQSGHNLQPEEITDWCIGDFTLPGWKEKFYQIIEDPNIYNNMKVTPYALEGINIIRRVDPEPVLIFCTHSTKGAAGRKLDALKEHGFWKDGDHFVETKSKFLIKADVIIDDNFDNIKNFEGELKLLVRRPWNKHIHHSPAFADWREFITLMEKAK
jgi:5'(3')-deoxyribonucleotidase